MKKNRIAEQGTRVAGCFVLIAVMVFNVFGEWKSSADTKTAKEFSTVSGKVFHDLNSNGIMDDGETPANNIEVSNGRNIVLSGPDGAFKLAKFTDLPTRIFITEPKGWKATTDFSCLAEGDGKEILFGLVETPDIKARNFSFIDGGDIQYELAKDSKQLTGDLQQLLEFQKQGKAVFSVWPGDLTPHGKIENLSFLKQRYRDLGLRFYPIFGGHDGLRSKPLRTSHYLKIMGPLAYAWNCGDLHFIGMVSEFSFLTKEQVNMQFQWLRKHLELLPRGTEIVLATHVPRSVLPKVLNMINAAGHRLLAILRAHLHCHNIQHTQGIPEICSAPWRPFDWGAFTKRCRFITYDQGRLSSHIRVLGQKQRMTILSPMRKTSDKKKLLIVANIYDTTHEVDSVVWTLSGAKKTLSSGKLRKKSDWTWSGETRSALKPGKYNIKIIARSGDVTWNSERFFEVGNVSDSLMELYWIHSTGNNIFYYSAPIIDKASDSVFMGLRDGQLGAEKAGVVRLDLSSGRQIWRTATGDDINSTVALYGNSVFALSNEGNLFRVDKNSGKIVWKKSIYEGLKTRKFPWRMTLAPLAVAEDKLYLVGGINLYCAFVCCFDAQSGKRIWHVTMKKGGFYYQCGGPAVSGDKILFEQKDRIRALDSGSGDVLWTTNVARERGLGTPCIQEGFGYFLYPNFLYKLDLETGRGIWICKSGGGFDAMGSAVCSGNKIIFPHGTRVTAVESSNGKTVWVFKTPGPGGLQGRQTIQNTSKPVVFEDTVYVGSDNGILYALDLKTGKEKWQYEIGVPIKSALAISDGKLVFCAYDGNVYAFDITKNP